MPTDPVRPAGRRAPALPLRAIAAMAMAARRDPLGALERIARDHGDLVRVALGPVRLHLVNRADLVEGVLAGAPGAFDKGRGVEGAKRLLGEGLLTAEGELHRRHRHAIDPIFHSGAIRAHAEVITRVASRFQQPWREGHVIDVQAEMGRLNLEIAVEILFGLDAAGPEGRRLAGALEAATAAFGRLVPPFVPAAERLPIRSNRRFERARSALDTLVAERTTDCRRQDGRRPDLLSALVGVAGEGAGGGMTNDEIRDEIVTFFSGHKSVAVALAWTLHALARHPRVDGALQAELEAAGDGAGLDDAGRLPYARMVVAEAMRLYPPIWMLARRTLRDHELGGHVVPSGSTVLVSPYLVHRHPAHYADPSSFRPERWGPDAGAELPRCAYLPFGAGPRSCVGEPLAWMEAVLVAAMLARRWRLEPVPDPPVELQPRVSLRARRGIPVVLRRRSG